MSIFTDQLEQHAEKCRGCADAIYTDDMSTLCSIGKELWKQHRESEAEVANAEKVGGQKER